MGNDYRVVVKEGRRAGARVKVVAGLERKERRVLGYYSWEGWPQVNGLELVVMVVVGVCG